MSNFRKQTWNNLLTAEMNVLYWTAMTRRYVKRDQNLKIFLACMTSGTVAGWGFWNNISIVWQSLSCLSALLAIAMPILNMEQKIAKMSEITGEWSKIRFEAENIWFKLEKSKESEFEKIESDFVSLRSQLTPIHQLRFVL